MVNKYLKLKYWIINHTQVIDVTSGDGHWFVINGRIFMLEND